MKHRNAYFRDFTMQSLMRKLCINFKETYNPNKLWLIGTGLFCKQLHMTAVGP